MTIAIVPLKATSERTPSKNFRRLAGKPLYRWAIDKLISIREQCELLDVFIYCDAQTWDMIDKSIKDEVFQLEEAEANSYPEGNGFFRDMAMLVPSHKCGKYANDHLMFVNATAPFVKQETYVHCIRMAHEPQYDSAVTAIPLIGRVWNEHRQAVNHDPTTCPRTQTQEPCWFESEAAWVVEPEVITRGHRRVGSRPFFHPVDWVEQTDLNYLKDFEKAEALLKLGVVED